MSAQKTKLQLCARNLTGVEHDLVDVTFTGLDLVGAVNNGAGYAIGSTAITVDGFSTNVPTGCVIGFAGDDTTYYVSTGGSSTAITIDPPLKAAVLDNVVVTIYPHFDISQYCTRVSDLSQRAEFTQNELIFDKQITVELFNKASIFYDRDTHSTGWGLTTSYFSTYNAQSSTDNQYLRISIKRNGTWYQKYVGKIVRDTLELDELNRAVSFQTESIFYGLKDVRLFEVPDIYNNHKYTSSSRKTKTVSGKYVDIIKRIFQNPAIGIPQKSYTVTAKYASAHTRTITVGTHTVQAGELFTVNISDAIYDGTFIADSVTSTTITYTKQDWYYGNGNISPLASAGDSELTNNLGGVFTVTGELSSSLYKIKFANHSTIYTCYFKGVDFQTIKLLSPSTLTSGVPNNTAFILSYPSPEHTEATATSAVNNGAGYGVGVTAITVDALSPTSIFGTDGYTPTAQMMCKFAGHATVYAMSATVNNTTINLATGLTNALVDNEAVSIYYPTPAVATTGLSVANGLTQHRILFDTASKYFDNEHQNWSYDLLDCWFIVQKWMKKTIENATCFDILKSFCIKFGAVVCIDYINGIPYTFFRSKINASASKKTLDSGDFVGSARLNANWRFVTTKGSIVVGQIEYWNGDSLESEFCYTETTSSNNQRFTNNPGVSGTDSHPMYNNYFNCATFNQLATGDKIKFRGDDTIYKVTNVSTTTITIDPILETSKHIYEPFSIYTDTNFTLDYANAFNIKLKYPDLYVACNGDSGGSAFRTLKFYLDGDGVVFGGLYTKEVLWEGTAPVHGVTLIPHVPINGGWVNYFNGHSIIISLLNNVNDHSISIIANRPDVPQPVGSYSTMYHIATQNSPSFYYLSSGYVERKNTDTFTNEMTCIVTSLVNGTGGSDPTLKRHLLNLSNGQDSSSNSAQLSEFGYYKFISDENATRTDFSDGYDSYGIYLHSDVLNPDYDDYVYFCGTVAGNGTIAKVLAFGSDTISAAFTGTAPVSAVTGIGINHGESTSQIYYFFNTVDDKIYVSTSTAWASITNICGGGATTLAQGTYCVSSDLSLSGQSYVNIWKGYDNAYFFTVRDHDKIYYLDNTQSSVACLKDTSGEAKEYDPVQVIGCDFQGWWGTTGTNSTSLHYDIVYNASKLAYKFYNQNRRILECTVRDADFGYIDYSLFDRVTVDSTILSAASGSPKFYVYGYDFNWETHDHKLTLLESVE